MAVNKRKKIIRIAEFKGLDRRYGPLTQPINVLRTAGFVDLSEQKLLPTKGVAQTTVTKETNDATRMAFFTLGTGKNVVLFSNSSDVRYAYNPKALWTDHTTESDNQAASTQLLSSYDDYHRVSFASYRKQVYIGNGFHATKVWDGVAAADDVGISGPGSAPSVTAQSGGSVTPGTHLVRYRYQNTETGYVSTASPIATIETTTANATVRVPVTASADGKVDRIIVEMTKTNDSFFWTAANAANSNANVDITTSDTNLGVATNIPVYPDDQSVTLHGAPPQRRLYVMHRDRMFAVGKVVHSKGTVDVTNGSTAVTGNSTGITSSQSSLFGDGFFLHIDGDTADYAIASTGSESVTLSANYGGSSDTEVSYEIYSKGTEVLQWSLPTYPESFPTNNKIEILQDKGDTLQAMIGHAGDLLIIGSHSMERFGYNQDPLTDGQIYPIQGNRGALNSACVVQANDLTIYGMDRQGMWMFDGGAPIHISSPIQEILDTTVDWSNLALFHVQYRPKTKSVRFWVTPTTSSRVLHYYEYFIDTQQWATAEVATAIVASTQIIDQVGNQYAAIMSDDGYLYADEIRDTWAVFPSTTATVKISAVTSQTEFEVTTEAGGAASMKANQAKLAGALVQNTSSSEWAMCDGGANQDANTLTIAAKFTTDAEVGDVLQIGFLPFAIKTKAITLSDMFDVQRGVEMWLYFEPTSSTEYVLVTLFKDSDTSVFADWDGQTYDNVLFTEDSQWIRVDMSETTGKVRIPIGVADGWRTMYVDIRTRASAIEPKIEAIYLIGYEAEEIGH